MNEEELQKIEQELLKQIDQEVDQDKQITQQAQEIAASLSLQGMANASINGREFAITYNTRGKNIAMVAADRAKYQLVGEKYRPYVIQAEVDNKFSLRENLEAVVESFIRHLVGAIHPEPLEEGDVIENE